MTSLLHLKYYWNNTFYLNFNNISKKCTSVKQIFVNRKPGARRRDSVKSLLTDIVMWETETDKERHFRKCWGKIIF